MSAPNISLPSSDEAECGILGCCLLCPTECIPEAIEAGCCDDWFHNPANQVIWPTLSQIEGGLDLITLQSRLKDQGRLEAVGGIGYLNNLLTSTPSAANLSYYLGIAKEKYQLRRSIIVGSSMVEKAQSHEAKPDEILDEAERDVLAIRRSNSADSTHTAKSLILSVTDRLERAIANPGGLDGLSTGFPDIDRKLLGMRPGELIGLAARPSHGKTSLAMNIAEYVAVDRRTPVGVFSLETSADKLMLRIICSRARVNSKHARQGVMNQQDMVKMVSATAQISPSPLYIRDRSGVSISKVKAGLRRLVQQYGIKLAVLDYFQLLSSETKRGENRERELAQCSIGLKEVAKELQIPIIVVIAINREIEKEQRRPRLSDLRECGQLEYDLDVCGMLFRPLESGAPPPDPNELEHPMTLYIAKSKEGECGDVSLFFRKQWTRFESVSRFQT